MNSNITIIKMQEVDNLEPSRFFGLLLSRVLTSIHMVHWYSTNFNVHEILGDLYEDLDGLFDKLQEEIIGTSKTGTQLFPSFDPEKISLEIDNYNTTESLMKNYYQTVTTLVSILNSQEFSTYIINVSSGLNNTKEDILSRINKSNYLLDMVSFGK